MSLSSQSDLKQAFNKQAKPLKQRKSAKSTLPVSIRVTAQEKHELQQMAGAKPISSYIRQRLFGDVVAARPKQYLKKQRQPRFDHVEIARLLGMFGQSQLATSTPRLLHARILPLIFHCAVLCYVGIALVHLLPAGRKGKLKSFLTICAIIRIVPLRENPFPAISWKANLRFYSAP